MTPRRIGLLPEHLIDQIKAGEVIERPGNLLKEILENSIDAGATKLELTLKNNGLDLISLKDNGHGISNQDLGLAFSRHATSKISRFEDLYQLHSFGFRGEALASIAAISKIQCISFTQEDAEGSEIRIEGGLIISHSKRSKQTDQQGTELIIQNLFYNTPARLKFIQSTLAEKNFIKKTLYSFILAHPQIEFSLKMDEEEKELIPRHGNYVERIEELYPKSKKLIQTIQRDYENDELQGFLLPGQIKGPVKIQNIYINQRIIADKQLHRIISQSLISSFGHDDFHYMLFLKLPSDHIDVNVHPNKTIIKIFEAAKLISLITGSIKNLAQISSGSWPAGAIPPSQLPLDNPAPTLQQPRHEYNFEGFFSPHQLTPESYERFIWIGPFFLRQTHQWEAIHAGKLLEEFVGRKLKSSFLSVPLLVSEPFKIIPSSQTLERLLTAGLELEKLSPDTIVLRSIPDWMNGFPLKDIVSSMLKNAPLRKLDIHPEDWSQSAWNDMVQEFSLEELISKKISVDLLSILKEHSP